MKKYTILILLAVIIGFQISNAQNVGIGVISPQEKLDIAGNIRSSALAGTANFNAGNGFVTADVNGTLGKIIAPSGSSLELWYQPSGQSYIRPLANNNIRVYGSGQAYGIYYDGGTNGVGGYFRTTLNPSSAVQGFSDVSGNQTYGYLGHVGTINLGTFNSLDGSAVYGFVDDPNRPAIIGRTATNASVAAVIGYSSIWIAGYFGADDDGTFGERPALYGQLNVSSSARSGYQPAIRGLSRRTATLGNPGITVGGYFTAQNVGLSAQDAVGVIGLAIGPTATAEPSLSGGGIAATIGFTAGGYMQGNTAAWAFVGYDGPVTRKIIGTGSVSEVIPTPNHGRVTLTAPESPEYWYIDYGTAQLQNGKAHVTLDTILREIAVIDAQNPIKVITQVNIPDCNGVAVINKTETGFDIVELKNGNSSGEIDYQIIVKPKTNYGEGRFPQAPNPAFLKQANTPAAARAANQPNPQKIYRWASDWDTYRYEPADFVQPGEQVPAGKYAGMYKTEDGQFVPYAPMDKAQLKKQK